MDREGTRHSCHPWELGPHPAHPELLSMTPVTSVKEEKRPDGMNSSLSPETEQASLLQGYWMPVSEVTWGGQHGGLATHRIQIHDCWYCTRYCGSDPLMVSDSR